MKVRDIKKSLIFCAPLLIAVQAHRNTHQRANVSHVFAKILLVVCVALCRIGRALKSQYERAECCVLLDGVCKRQKTFFPNCIVGHQQLAHTFVFFQRMCKRQRTVVSKIVVAKVDETEKRVFGDCLAEVLHARLTQPKIKFSDSN